MNYMNMFKIYQFHITSHFDIKKKVFILKNTPSMKNTFAKVFICIKNEPIITGSHKIVSFLSY